MTTSTDKNRIVIFDTTLRDGEQSPGCSMNIEEKLRIAELLERLSAFARREIDQGAREQFDRSGLRGVSKLDGIDAWRNRHRHCDSGLFERADDRQQGVSPGLEIDRRSATTIARRRGQ